MRVWKSAILAAAVALTPMSVYAQGEEAPEEMQGHVNVGDTAPGFTLEDQNGNERSLDELVKGEGILALVFYRSANW